ncbi:hypothetical protein AAF712_007823 [Marasmius tenuissimus]|uniref:CCZ1/INTU/HSP4 first Longin domain-containing protein n=1 Tax=Marasmius tenuissimus TaxID=585030 RepID=A0ABR2ZUR9_9AGAR
MARVPPNLSYVTIYNPTLKPSADVSKDDEDAEEQAQILFYTSKERAASRDNMLRQIGLAKALANFSESFSGGEFCDSIHSQTRRMIMMCPEPDFWIHAAVEFAKTPRTPTLTRANAKGKGKEKQKEPALTYDYSDASVHVTALKADIMKGYERFKLTHGSFTSILTNQGRTALELQLERFFTVWAWSWDIETGFEFGDHLGVPLHPTHALITPLLDQLSSTIPDSLAPIFATSTHIIPSKRYLNGRLPISLSRHIISLVPPPPEPSEKGPTTNSESTTRHKKPPDPEGTKENTSKHQSNPSVNSFMGIPTGNLNMNVNVKWSWPGYLTFGKSNPQDRPMIATTPAVEKKPHEEPHGEGEAVEEQPPPRDRPEEVEVDKNALDDAISSEGVHTPDTLSKQSNFDVEDGDKREVEDEPVPSPPSEPPVPHTPPRPFSSIGVHIADPLNPLLTKKRKIHFLSQPGRSIVLASIAEDHDLSADILDTVSAKVDALFVEIDRTTNDPPKSASSDGTTPVAKLLQQKDRHIMALPQFTVSSSASQKRFTSKSQHLFNVQQFLESDPEIKEVFSRGQNPQNWHVGRRVKEGDAVYMEVYSKESSLTDVDNSLTGVVRHMEEFEDL